MLNKRYGFLVVLSALGLTTTSVAQELMIFPNADQSAEQQEQDKYACYNWAKGESGFDPMAPPTATAPPPQQDAKRGGAGRGMVRGAALGAIIGDSSDAAAKGAAAGALVGGMRRRDQINQEDAEREQWERDQQRIYEEKRNRYNRAYAACLEGKDYTVR